MEASSEARLSRRVIFGYPLAQFGPTLQTCIQMYFLLYFFTDVLGISGTAAALIIMCARIWDFINDPLMAALLTKSKHPEKCLFYMKAAIIPVCIFFILTYTAPQFSTAGKIVWAALMFVGLGMSQTVYSIASNTLRPTLIDDRAERNRLNRMENIFSLVGNLLIPSATMPLVAVLMGFEVSAPFMVLAALYAIVYCICSAAGIMLLKGSEHDESLQQETQTSKTSFVSMFKAVSSNLPALSILLAQVVKYLISSIAGAVMVYYFTYNLDDVNLMSMVSLLAGTVGLVPALFLPMIFKKFGNAGAGFLGCIIAGAAMLVRFVTHDASAAIVLGMSAVEAIGLELTVAMLVQCLMDCVIYGEWKTGRNDTPIVMSLYGMGTKFGLAFGTTISGIVLDLIGYNADAAEQTLEALNGFFTLSVTLPLIMYVLLAFFYLYLRKIENKLDVYTAEINARKMAATTDNNN